MSIRSSLLLLLLTGAVPALATAQIGRGEVGLYLATQAGSGGTTCTPTYSCGYLPATLTRGETITITVRGVYQMPFVIALSGTQQSLCLPLQGILHELMFVPAWFPFVGILDQGDPILRCPGGLKTLSLPIPNELAPGTDLFFQALAWSYYVPWGGPSPTLTMAVQATVQ